MKTDKNLFLLIVVMLFATSCSREQSNIFPQSPALRTQQSINSLKQKLIASENGWKMTYFPNIDIDKFSDINYNVYTHESSLLFLDSETGFGGYTFWLKFSADGKVEMLSDNSEEATKMKVVSDYDIKLVSGIQLSFITKNYIHDLIEPGFKGSSDFIHKRTDNDGKLIFATTTHAKETSEYIVLEKIKSNTKWQSEIDSVLAQKKLFESWEKPVLTIKNSEGKVLFQSNYTNNGYFNNDTRYALFIKDHTPQTFNPEYFSGIGSGYLYTPIGMFFKGGLKYNEGTTFTTFERTINGTFQSTVNGYTAEIKQ